MEIITKKRMMLFTGTIHPALGHEIADCLSIPVSESDLRRFASGEIYFRAKESVRGADVFVVQTHYEPVNEALMEQLIMIDAMKRASAKRITAVIPYYGYSRQDHKALSREPISAKLVADLLWSPLLARWQQRRDLTPEYADAVDKGCPMVLGGPLSHVMAAKAVALAEARQPAFQAYSQRVADNAKALAEGFLKRGATLITGGTDNHIVLLDVQSFGVTGRQAESALLDAGVVTNRNSVPADPNGAWYTSGIRLGTPACTTRGFGVAEFRRVGELIVEVLDGLAKHGEAGNAETEAAAKTRAEDLTRRFPIYA